MNYPKAPGAGGENLAKQVEALRVRIRHAAGAGMSYSQRLSLYAEVKDYLQARRAQGVSTAQVARELHMVRSKLYQWLKMLRKYRPQAPEESACNTAASVDAPSSQPAKPDPRLVLTTPEGHKIEGADAGEVFRLYRKLASTRR